MNTGLFFVAVIVGLYLIENGEGEAPGEGGDGNQQYYYNPYGEGEGGENGEVGENGEGSGGNGPEYGSSYSGSNYSGWDNTYELGHGVGGGFARGYGWYDDDFYNWAVAIYKSGSEERIPCGGVLVNSVTVLTSAQCIYKENVWNSTVFVKGFVHIAGVSYSVMHEAYSVSTQKNDIGVLHIQSGSLGFFPEHGFPDVLSDKKFDKKVERKNNPISCYIFGMNITSAFDQNIDPMLIKKVPTKLQRLTSKKGVSCQKTMRKTNKKTKLAGDMHLCTKDKGNPCGEEGLGWALGCYDDDDKNQIEFRVVGIKVWNDGCKNGGPNAFTKVSKYENWIRDHTKVPLTYVHQ